MAKGIANEIYRWKLYPMLIIISLTFGFFRIALLAPFVYAIRLKECVLFEERKAFWNNIDSMVHRIKEKLRLATDEKRKEERKIQEKAIRNATKDLDLLSGYNVNPWRYLGEEKNADNIIVV